CGVTGLAREGNEPAATAGAPTTEDATSPALVAEGQQVFRFETFGDEHVWTEPLHLNDVVEKNVDPTTALKVGLKVDKSPATTVALLKMNAIVGLQATVDADDH